MSAGVEPQMATEQAGRGAAAGGPDRLRLAAAGSSPRRPIAKLVIIAILAIWPFFYQDLYTLSWMTFAGLSLMVVVSVYLIIAQAGQLSFGHAAFYGVGAYTASILSVRYNVPTLLALVIGAALAGVIALVIGRPVLKLRYFYLALATIGLGIIFGVIVVQAAGITGGTLGLAPVPPLDLFGFKIDTYFRQYYLVWIVALLILLFTERALGMRVGRALRAIATSEIAAETLGVRTANWKLIAFVASAVFCAIAGGLYAFVLSAITPVGVRLQRRHPPDHHDADRRRRVHLGRPRGRRAHDVDLQQPLRHPAVERRHLLGHHDPPPAVPADGHHRPVHEAAAGERQERLPPAEPRRDHRLRGRGRDRGLHRRLRDAGRAADLRPGAHPGRDPGRGRLRHAHRRAAGATPAPGARSCSRSRASRSTSADCARSTR